MYGYDDGSSNTPCVNNQAFGWIAALFFVAVVVFGGMVLPTVLVGIISVAFEEGALIRTQY